MYEAGVERIPTSSLFHANDNHGKVKRVEAGFGQHYRVGIHGGRLLQLVPQDFFYYFDDKLYRGIPGKHMLVRWRKGV